MELANISIFHFFIFHYKFTQMVRLKQMHAIVQRNGANNPKPLQKLKVYNI